VWVAAWRRSAAATLTGPARLSTPIARLRKVAMTVGALPVRTWEASSAKVTSRTQCRSDRYCTLKCAACGEADVHCTCV
jgi:hypothetical protein